MKRWILLAAMIALIGGCRSLQDAVGEKFPANEEKQEGRQENRSKLANEGGDLFGV